MRSGCIAPRLFHLGTSCRLVASSRPGWIIPCTHLIRSWVGPIIGLGSVKTKFLTVLPLELGPPQRWARSQTLYRTLLSRPFVWFLHKRAVHSLNSSNRFNFVAQTQCVSCEVRTEFIYQTEEIRLPEPSSIENMAVNHRTGQHDWKWRCKGTRGHNCRKIFCFCLSAAWFISIWHCDLLSLLHSCRIPRTLTCECCFNIHQLGTFFPET
jgi:hypothetical protein